MSLPLVAFIVGSVANALLAVFVIRRNPRSATHKLFALLCTAIILWAIANYLSIVTTTYYVALWSIRVVMALAIIQAVLFALLMYTFPRIILPISRRSVLIVVAVVLLGQVVALSPYLFTTIQFQGGGQPPQPAPGWGMVIFVPVVLSSLILGFWQLVKKNIQARGVEKVQQQYLLLGFLLTFGLLVVFLLFFSVVRSDTKFVPYAPFFTVPFVGMTAYAIVRYRLMDVRLALARSLSFSTLIGLFALLYSLVLIFAVPRLAEATGIASESLAAFGALVSVWLARFIQDRLKQLTDNIFFQHRLDFKKELVKLSDELAGTINIKEVTDLVLRAVREILHSEKVIIMLQDAKGTSLLPSATSGVTNFNVTIPSTHAFMKHLRHAAGPVVKDEITILKEQEHSPVHTQELNEIQHALTWLDVAVVVPLFVNHELTGLILLGEKLSGEPYLQDDVSFLATFAPQAATALENARLYQESLAFGEKLKKEVDQATRELAHANLQLKDLDKAKSEFLSIASHQLYTPLTALRGYLSMLLEGDYGKIQDKQKSVMDILQQSTTRLIDLIKNLLDISRIESGRLELKLESVDMVKEAKDLVGELMPNALRKQLKLYFEQLSVHIAPVVADEERLRQVMLNFIDNAIKYTEHGQVRVTLKQEADSVIFSVHDTGKGLTAEEITRLFSKFMRVGGASRYNTEGVGLGLYVAKQIIKEHRGDVLVESAGLGHGSTFSVHLPAEGSPGSLKIGEKATVVIKAAEAQQK